MVHKVSGWRTNVIVTGGNVSSRNRNLTYLWHSRVTKKREATKIVRTMWTLQRMQRQQVYSTNALRLSTKASNCRTQKLSLCQSLGA